MPDVPFPPDEPARPPARPGLRDLLDAHRRPPLTGGVTAGRLATGAVVVLLVVVGGVVLWPRPAAPDPELSLPRASTTLSLPTAAPDAAPAGVGTATPTTATTLAELVVDVAGEVRQPGVRRLPAGARIADVVEAAGGLTARADRARINLAAPVHDGERVFVPAVGQAVPPVAVGVDSVGGGSGGTAAGATGTTVAAGPVDLNTASLAELDTLPGVGPATAQAIIDHREQQGPFRSVDDLLDVRGIGDAKLAELRPLVTV